MQMDKMQYPTITGDKMEQQDAAALRKPFDKKEINQIPKRNNKTGSTVYLDYVGHANVTDRLLQVDPTWTWRPLATDPNGMPLLDDFGGLWIDLTVAGVTKVGYGWADGDKGGNAIKEAIGDAIRNAAMRFGVALDLWMKEPATIAQPAQEKPARDSKPAKKLPANVPAALADETERISIAYLAIGVAVDTDALKKIWADHNELLDVEYNDTTIRKYILSRKAELETAGE
jgi:hypothetical protein